MPPRLFRRWPAVLLILSLTALVAAGIRVGDLYRHQVREQMARLERSMALARDRQEDLLRRLADGQRLIEAQQRQIGLQAWTLDSTQRRLQRRNEELQRYRDHLERLLEKAHERRRQKERDAARDRAERIQSAQAQVRLATGLLQGDDPDPEAAVAALQQARERLAPLGVESLRQTLAARIEAIRHARGRIIPPDLDERLAGLARAIRTLERPGRPRQRPLIPWARIQGALRQQIEGARLALRRGDPDLYRAAMDTARLWLETFYDPRSPHTRRLLDDLNRLQKAVAVKPRWPDLGPLEKAIAALGAGQ